MPLRRSSAAWIPQWLIAASITSVSEWPRNALADRLQLLAKGLEIVDFAVEDDHVASAGGLHRLMAGGREVDDRQPAKADSHARCLVDPGSAVVGSPMVQGLRHALDGGTERRSVGLSLQVEKASDTAHSMTPRSVVSTALMTRPGHLLK